MARRSRPCPATTPLVVGAICTLLHLGGGGQAQAQPARLVKDANPSGDSSLQQLTALGATLLYAAQETECRLWKSDGTLTGTTAISGAVACNSSSSSSDRYPTELTVVGDTLYFVTGIPSGYSLRYLWKSDGTAAGTTLFQQFAGSSVASGLVDLVAVNGLLFFRYHNWTGSVNAVERTDGTEAGTVGLVYWVNGAGYSSNLTNFGGALYFSAHVGTARQLWKSDGTVAGTVRVANLTPAASGPPTGEIAVVGTTLFFTFDDAVHGLELWKTDGTQAETAMVRDIHPGLPQSQAQALRAVGNRLFFAADDGASGYELWMSDGTEQGTVMVKDIRPGAASSLAGKLRSANGVVFFQASDGVSGIEPWRSDGTAGGTVMVQDIAVGPSSSSPEEFTAAGSQLFFSADDGLTGRELWVMPAPELRRAPGDAHGEGRADMMTRNALGEVEILQSSGAAFTSGSPWRREVAPGTTLVSYADVDGDGRSDLITRSPTGDLRVYRSTGAFFDPVPGPAAGGTWTWGWLPEHYDLYLADVTGDGRADLIARVKDPANAGGWAVGDIWVLPSTGSGFGGSGVVPWSYGWSTGYDLYFADVTGDGRADIVSRYFGPTTGLTGDVYVGASTGTRFASPTRWTYGYSSGYDLYLADASGDGRSDLVARYFGPTAGLTGDVHVMVSTGTGFAWNGSVAPWTYGWGSTYDLVVRDFTGDGKADLAGRHRGNGDVYVSPSTGTLFVSPGTWATGVHPGRELH